MSRYGGSLDHPPAAGRKGRFRWVEWNAGAPLPTSRPLAEGPVRRGEPWGRSGPARQRPILVDSGHERRSWGADFGPARLRDDARVNAALLKSGSRHLISRRPQLQPVEPRVAGEDEAALALRAARDVGKSRFRGLDVFAALLQLPLDPDRSGGRL